jgi:hypothetical protein
MSDKSKDEKLNVEEIERVYKDITTKKYCKTDILDNLKFESKMDKFVFDHLPLSNSQKEELLLSMFSKDNNIETIKEEDSGDLSGDDTEIEICGLKYSMAD